MIDRRARAVCRAPSGSRCLRTRLAAVGPRSEERSRDAEIPGQDVDARRTDRVLTVPNVLSALRLLGVPLFLWLVMTERDGLAVAVLMVSGFTDWLDGLIARRWNQMSRIGALLDPAADRLYILATLVGLTVRDIVPLWLTLLLVGRDVVLAGFLPVLRRHGYGPLPVHFLGKAATFNLLSGFPLLLLGGGDSIVSQVAHAFGWAFAIWGTVLYWLAGVFYAVQVRQVIAADAATERSVT